MLRTARTKPQFKSLLKEVREWQASTLPVVQNSVERAFMIHEILVMVKRNVHIESIKASGIPLIAIEEAWIKEWSLKILSNFITCYAPNHTSRG